MPASGCQCLYRGSCSRGMAKGHQGQKSPIALTKQRGPSPIPRVIWVAINGMMCKCSPETLRPLVLDEIAFQSSNTNRANFLLKWPKVCPFPAVPPARYMISPEIRLHREKKKCLMPTRKKRHLRLRPPPVVSDSCLMLEYTNPQKHGRPLMMRLCNSPLLLPHRHCQ